MNTTQLPVAIVPRHIVRPRLDVYYPEISGLKNWQVERRLNERIRRQVNAMLLEQGYPRQLEMTITGGFEIKTNQRDILSLTNSHYSYSGGAHGMTILRSLTMNVQNGSVYRLKDLFKPGADYVNRLNELIAAQIKERNLPLLSEFKGISENQSYYLADKALVIYFQLYELVPYAWGFPFFVISVYGVQDLLVEDGAFGRMSY